MRTLRTYFPNSFPVYPSAPLTVAALPYITPLLICLATGSWHLLVSNFGGSSMLYLEAFIFKFATVITSAPGRCAHKT